MKIDFAKLDDMLLDRCWTFTYLAKQAGISPATLITLKNDDKRAPARLTVAKLAKALEVKPREIMLQE